MKKVPTTENSALFNWVFFQLVLKLNILIACFNNTLGLEIVMNAFTHYAKIQYGEVDSLKTS